MTASSRMSVDSLELGFDTVKTLGVVGALFLIATYLAFFLSELFPPLNIWLLGAALQAVGMPLVLLSLYYYSKLYGNPSIYTNSLYFSALILVAIVVYLFAEVIIRFTLFDPKEAGLAKWLYWLAEWLYTVNGGDPRALTAQVRATLLEALLSHFAFLLFLFFFLVAMFFYNRALSSMADSSQVELFRYAGLLGLVGVGLQFLGGLLLIVPIFILSRLLSFLVLIASFVLLLVAFLEIKEPQPSPPPQPIAPAAPA